MQLARSAGAACVALAASFLPLLAGATPGQSVTAFQAWAKGNAALHGLAQKTNEMSGAPYFTATFKAGSVGGFFNATVGDGGKIVDESVAVGNVPDAYDILKHLDTAALMLQTVYGEATASDFKAATLVGRWTLHGETSPTALYRGKLFGYEAAFAFVKLIPAGSVAGEAKQLQACVNTECGD